MTEHTDDLTPTLFVIEQWSHDPEDVLSIHRTIGGALASLCAAGYAPDSFDNTRRELTFVQQDAQGRWIRSAAIRSMPVKE